MNIPTIQVDRERPQHVLVVSNSKQHVALTTPLGMADVERLQAALERVGGHPDTLQALAEYVSVQQGGHDVLGMLDTLWPNRGAEVASEAQRLLDLIPTGPVHAELGRVWTPNAPTPGDGTWTERHTHLNRAARRASRKRNRR